MAHCAPVSWPASFSASLSPAIPASGLLLPQAPAAVSRSTVPCLGTPFTLFQGAAFFDRPFTLVTPPHPATIHCPPGRNPRSPDQPPPPRRQTVFPPQAGRAGELAHWNAGPDRSHNSPIAGLPRWCWAGGFPPPPSAGPTPPACSHNHEAMLNATSAIGNGHQNGHQTACESSKRVGPISVD